MAFTVARAFERVLALAPDRAWERWIASNGNDARVGTSARWIVSLVRVDGGVELSARRPRERRDERFVLRVSDDGELDAVAAELCDLMLWWAERLTLHALVPGRTYRVGKTFRDYTGGELAAGEELTYVEKQFLPYDGGHTVVFAGGDGARRSVYLQEEAQGEILGDFDVYFVG